MRPVAVLLLLAVLMVAGCGGDGETTTVTKTVTSPSDQPTSDPATADSESLPIPVDLLMQIDSRDDDVQEAVTDFQGSLGKCAALAQNNELDATARCVDERYKPLELVLVRLSGELAKSEPKATGDCSENLSSVRTSLGNFSERSDDLNTSFNELEFDTEAVDRWAAAFERYRTKMDTALITCQA